MALIFACINKNTPVRKTTFMLGENGTGKSALLKAIALLTSGSNSLGDVLGNPDDWINNKKDFCEIAAVIVTQRGEERAISLRLQRGQGLSDIIVANHDSLQRIDDAIKMPIAIILL